MSKEESKENVFDLAARTNNTNAINQLLFGSSETGDSHFGSACNAFIQSFHEVSSNGNIGLEEVRVKDFMEESAKGSSTLFKEVLDFFVKSGVISIHEGKDLNRYYLKESTK